MYYKIEWMNVMSVISCCIVDITHSLPPAYYTLVGHEGANEGYVAMNTKDGWKFVCDEYWGAQNAKVVCRELGYIKHLSTSSKRYVSCRNCA